APLLLPYTPLFRSQNHLEFFLMLSPNRSLSEPVTASPIASTAEIIAEIGRGNVVVLVDDEDRENEGDLVCAADFVTAEKINFLAKYGRGLICMPITE